MLNKLITPIKLVFYWLRTLLFYLLFSSWTACFSVLVIAYAIIFRSKFNHSLAIKPWGVVTIYLAKWIAGISWKIEGKENIPKEPCVLLSNHQSAWETFFFQAFFSPQVTVVKKELLRIPFFGQSLAAAKAIAIDRSKPKQALNKIKTQGKQAIDAKKWVLIFPEGTRSKAQIIKKFSRGGATLAKHAQTVALPIAQNSGCCWLNNSWLKLPGEIKITILKPITTDDKTPEEITNLAHDMINDTLSNINKASQ
jgi:1-acyl-sn-glycerol-3-phosphate acyltransferase